MPASPDWGWQDNNPMVSVCWEDARAYAAWAGAALPSEAQWEKAARGTDGNLFPWGNRYDWRNPTDLFSRCKCDGGDTEAVDSHPAGASPYGCLDMAGNVCQWCADWYGEDYYRHSPRANPTGPTSGTQRVLRGGDWAYGFPYHFRVTNRSADDPRTVGDLAGFRCVVCTPAGS